MANLLLLVVLRVEGHSDADADILFNLAALLLSSARCGLVFARIVLLCAVGFAVDDQATGADGDEFLENTLEGDGDLFEGTCDGLVLTLVEYIYEVFDRLTRAIEFNAAICEGFALSCEILVLFVGLLVDMCELLLCLSGLRKLFSNLVILVSGDGRIEINGSYLICVPLAVLAIDVFG